MADSLDEKDLHFWSEIYNETFREPLIKELKGENNPENLYDFLERSHWYLHEEHTKYKFRLNEEKCKPISKGLLCCCKIISEKMVEQADVEYAYLAEEIRECLNECAYYIPEDSQEYQDINQNLNRYFSNAMDEHFKNPEVMLEIGKLISRREDSDLFEKYVNKVFEQYGKQSEVCENLLSVFDDGYVFKKAGKLKDNPYVFQLIEQRLEGKDITNIQSLYDYIDSKEALLHILKLPNEKAQSLKEEKALDIIDNCSEIIEEYAEDKQIAQSISDLLFKISPTPEIMEKMSPICKAISKSHSDIKVPSVRSFKKRLAQETMALLAEGKLEEALDKFAYITSSQAYKDANDDSINRVVQKMPNGCIAVGFLREKRNWDKPTPGWGGSSGIEWKWYGQGFIIDPKKMKVTTQCQTKAITVRDKYSASRDIYQHINIDKIIEVEGNKLSVSIGGYVSASTEYDPKKETQKEDSLARIKKNKDVLAQRTEQKVPSVAASTPAHSNSSNSSGANGRGDGGHSDGR